MPPALSSLTKWSSSPPSTTHHQHCKALGTPPPPFPRHPTSSFVFLLCCVYTATNDHQQHTNVHSPPNLRHLSLATGVIRPRSSVISSLIICTPSITVTPSYCPIATYWFLVSSITYDIVPFNATHFLLLKSISMPVINLTLESD